LKNHFRSFFLVLTISVDVDPRSAGQEEFHDLQRSGFGAIVQCGVPLDGLAVDVGLLLHQILCDLVVAFVARDHQASVAVPVGDFNVCKTKNYNLKENSKNNILIDVGSTSIL